MNQHTFPQDLGSCCQEKEHKGQWSIDGMGVNRIQSMARAEPRFDSQSQGTLGSDDPKKTGQDRQRIALKESHEVRSWTESLGVTEQQLKPSRSSATAPRRCARVPSEALTTRAA
ncbi:DUF3606 domain-containing protein [Variovorax sp. J22R24]|uniref:DUF3606 domain-containing protein n=1 Tax=Variovorax gracilis TaxID=3053502 RepID=UPI002574C79B|nr:DUF3606 domain-containing protein [Variovorax sp. J22R24]MDM0108859.1 DUF3606 domain-containing protein [Variovorax sp. J22R24]